MNTKADINGEVHDVVRPVSVRTSTESEVLTVDDIGTVVSVGTDALVHTLPLVGASPEQARAGSQITLRNTGADGAVALSVSPDSTNAIYGTVGSSISGGALDKDFVNTKATANKGDYVTLESDGIVGWYIVGGVGIWASQA